jgi:putative CocE/NonD family hydrolase
VSYVVTPGSVDVQEALKRNDVVSFTTSPLESDLDVVGPVWLVLYASSTAIDTDFVARLSDVFPDGRSIQLQNGLLRTRYRHLGDAPQPLEPGKAYRFDIDLWATANRFRAGHRLRLDISSADFPKLDRNTNRGGAPGDPIVATQTIYFEKERDSHLVIRVLDDAIKTSCPPLEPSERPVAE